MKRFLIIITLASATLLPACPASAAAPPACVFGRLDRTDAGIVHTQIAAARAAFLRSLHGVGAAAKRAAGDRFVTDLAAWVYGFPAVIVRRTIATFPRNTMVSIGKLADTTTVSIVAPNHDTLYSVAQIDLSSGPIVIHTPPTGGRYSVIQLTDAWTNAAAYLGDGAAARTGETAVLVAPGWHGALPAHARVIRPQTRLLWLLGRTLATTTADQKAAVALLSRYSVTPLAAYLAGTRTPPIVLADFPTGRKPVKVPAGKAFFDELGADLAADPPPARDRCAVAAFRHAGIGAGQTPAQTLHGLPARALAAAATAGPRFMRAVVERMRQATSRSYHGWLNTPPDTARFGTDYVSRAAVALIGLGANTVAQALYPNTDRDSVGRPLSGRHVYHVRFAPGQLPPVRQFWSLTLYDSRILFYANPLNRYAIGDRSAGLRRDADGGLTIIVSHSPPPKAWRANWLPAPAGSFSLYLRLYEPRPAAARGVWRPPPVLRVR